MDDGMDGWMTKTYMQIPLINAYKDDEESPFDTCLEKGISTYISWKSIGK
jgi:hypothetical protein